MTIEYLNKLFENINYPSENLLINKQTITLKENDYYKREDGKKEIIYKLKDIDDLYLKYTYNIDSYGYETLQSIKFVKQVEKTVVTFE